MIAQKNRMNKTKAVQEGLKILVDLVRFIAIAAQDAYFGIQLRIGWKIIIIK